jgi:hypothetical protein
LGLAVGVLLIRKGWRFVHLARHLGMSHQKLSARVFQPVPTRDTIELIAAGLGIPWGDVLEVMLEETKRLEADGQSIGLPMYRDVTQAVVTVAKEES